MADMIKIVAKLAERSNEQRIPWKSTVNPNSFTAVVGELSVIVSSEPTSRWDPPKVSLSILEADGTEITSIRHDPYGLETERNPSLIQLFDAARGTARKVDERLDQLLATLETGL